MVDSKFVGSCIMIIAIVFFLIGYAYTGSSEQALLQGYKVDSSGQCVNEPGSPCPYVKMHSLSVVKHFGLFADLVLFGFGVWLFAQRKPEDSVLAKAKRSIKALGGEEAKVFDLIIQSNGLVFQHELVNRMSVSKVRMTRLLDNLESKGLIERRRRGMTNIVVLK
ncbi:MAG: MarR family transcriptional regulator [Nanoarchaeota archaeon]